MAQGYNVGDMVSFNGRDGKVHEGRVFGVGLKLDYDIQYYVNRCRRWVFSLPSTQIIGKIDKVD